VAWLAKAITGLSPILPCARNSFARAGGRRRFKTDRGYEGGELGVIYAARATDDLGGFFAVLCIRRR
jgi:hypothetical protein